MSDAVCARTAALLARLVPGDNRALVPGDFVCLYELLVPRDDREAPIQPQTLQQTQLAHNLGLLLGRVLDQHRVRPFGWQREGYCSMVQASADALCSVLASAIDSDSRRPPMPAQKSAQLVVVQQIASSGLFPKLANAMSKLADMMQATEVKSPPYKLAALGLQQVAVNLIAVWPGSGGVLTSAAASAIVVPAVQLAAAMVQHDIAAPDSCSTYSELALASSCRLVMYLGSMLLDERLRRSRSPVPQPLQGVSLVMAGLASSALQQLVLTVLILATDPNMVSAMFCRACEDTQEPVAKATDGQHSAASGAVQRPPAADKASRAPIADGNSSSRAQHGSASSSSGDPDGVAAQQMELCHHQQLLLLHIYPALRSSSRWADFAVVSAAALSRVELRFVDFQFVTEAAIACFSYLTDVPLNVGEDESASCSSSAPQAQAAGTQAPVMNASSLNVLPQLPVLLLQWATVTAGTPAAYLNRSAVYEAVYSLSADALDCWEHQLRLNRSQASGSEEVNSRDQLPAARIAELLLQNMRLLQHQQQQALASRAATSTPTEAVGPRSSAAAAAAATARPTDFDEMVVIVSFSHLSQLMDRLKPSLDTAVWHRASGELFSMLEWWLRVGSSSHEEQQPQPQQSETRSSSSSSSSSAAYVALQWHDSPRFMRLYESGQLSGAVCRYRELTRACEVWLLPAEYKTYESINWYDSVLLPSVAAAAPGSFERQQLLTLMISLLKKSSSTDGVLTLMPTGHARDLEVTIGCDLCCVVGAVQYMLNLCGLCGSSDAMGGPHSNTAVPGSSSSSSTQGTCTTMAGTTGRGSSSSSSNNGTSAGCNSDGGSADKCQAATAAAAAAPWMIVAARALINKAARLDRCLESQPEVPEPQRILRDLHDVLRQNTESVLDAAAAHAFLAKLKPMMSDELVKLIEYTDPILHWTECVRPITCTLETALLGLTGQQGAASGSTTLTGLAVAADSGSGTTTSSSSSVEPAAPGEVLHQTAAAPAATVSSVRQAQFGSALQQLKQVPLKLQQLADICNMQAPKPYVLRESEPAQWLQNISKVGLTAEVVEALRTASRIDAFKDALHLWGVRQFQQQLVEAGQLVCAALPLKYFCNSPMCMNLSKNTEADVVNGKGCVCARCETARYCNRECQAAHWPWHKAICKAIKKQSRSSSRTD